MHRYAETFKSFQTHSSLFPIMQRCQLVMKKNPGNLKKMSKGNLNHIELVN